MEPNAVSSPSLPLEEGEYDAALLRRQREIIQDAQNQMKKLAEDVERARQQANIQVAEKEEKLGQAQKELQITQKQLEEATQKLSDVAAAAAQLKQDEEAKRKAKKKWKFW
jgi:hypothetical protein